MFAFCKETVNQRKHEIVYNHVAPGSENLITPLNGIIKGQIFEVNLIGLCACIMKENLEC